MIRPTALTLAVLVAGAGTAEDTRQLGAHEHGVGQLDIAFDGSQIAMELHAPGADIVGFEYSAKTAQDRAKVDAAVATLARPLDLFALPEAAGCSVAQASASLESEAEHEHEEHGHDDHDHDEHNHDDHADEERHTEFHAAYLLECADATKANLITFAYFETFPNALELEVQVISDKGATRFEVVRDVPSLDLRDMF